MSNVRSAEFRAKMADVDQSFANVRRAFESLAKLLKSKEDYEKGLEARITNLEALRRGDMGPKHEAGG